MSKLVSQVAGQQRVLKANELNSTVVRRSYLTNSSVWSSKVLCISQVCFYLQSTKQTKGFIHHVDISCHFAIRRVLCATSNSCSQTKWISVVEHLLYLPAPRGGLRYPMTSHKGAFIAAVEQLLFNFLDQAVAFSSGACCAQISVL